MGSVPTARCFKPKDFSKDRLPLTAQFDITVLLVGGEGRCGLERRDRRGELKRKSWVGRKKGSQESVARSNADLYCARDSIVLKF